MARGKPNATLRTFHVYEKMFLKFKYNTDEKLKISVFKILHRPKFLPLYRDQNFSLIWFLFCICLQFTSHIVSLKVAWRILEFPIHSELLGNKIIDVFILWIIWSAWDRKHLLTVIYCTVQWVCLGSFWVWFVVLSFIFSQGFLLTCFLLTVSNLPVFTLRQASVLLITPFIIVLRTLPSGVKLILCSLHHYLLQLN